MIFYQYILRVKCQYILTLYLNFIIIFNMVMKNNYPDYKRISETMDKLHNLNKDDDEVGLDEEEFEKYYQLREELKTLIMGELIMVESRKCNENNCFATDPIYYPGKVHHVDGDINNDSFSNLAMVCLKCQSHILLSRFSPEELWLLKAKGLSNAEIGSLLGISRERVRQLSNKYKPKDKIALTATDLRQFSETDNIDELVKKYRQAESRLIAQRKLKRRADIRTIKKHIRSIVDKLNEQQR